MDRRQGRIDRMARHDASSAVERLSAAWRCGRRSIGGSAEILGGAERAGLVVSAAAAALLRGLPSNGAGTRLTSR